MSIRPRIMFFLLPVILHGACIDFGSAPLPPWDGGLDGDAAEGEGASETVDGAGDPVTAEDGSEDGGVVDGEGDAEGDGCEAVCEAYVHRCREGNLEECDGGGCSFVLVEECAAGCIESPPARCAEIVPSNIADPWLLCEGSSPLALPPGGGITLVTLDTDDGSITGIVSPAVAPVTLRGEGEGDKGGIVFIKQDIISPVDPPGLGIFAFSSFTVPKGVRVVGTGTRALVVLSCGDVEIAGVLSVGACPGFGLYALGAPGPGGGAGGGASGGHDGSGPGGGGSGREGGPSPGYNSGGGGGGYGGAGGWGGDLWESGRIPGGRGGPAYGTGPIVPLVGGSGGGGTVEGGRGGGGGGALQLVSGTGIVVTSEGAIDAGGGGGEAGDLSAIRGPGGGGGGSGGSILFEAPTVVIDGIVTAAGGGGGGGGGVLSSDGTDGYLSLVPAQGGAGNMGSTSGGNGSDPEGCNGSSGEEGGWQYVTATGGGGGACGWIRINHFAPFDASAGGFHPAVAGAAWSDGPLATR